MTTNEVLGGTRYKLSLKAEGEEDENESCE